MSPRLAPLEGRPCWNELRTRDPGAAIEFYGRLFGWRTRPEERETYVHFYVGQRAVAGVTSGDASVAPFWQVHFATADMRSSRARVVAAGGSLSTDVMDLPETGLLSIVADPEGAFVALYQPTDPERDSWRGSRQPGHFCWAELACRDGARARRFYQEVLGWSASEAAPGELDGYTLFSVGDEAVSGMLPMPADVEARAEWLPYVAVESASDCAVEALGLQAEVLVPPTDLPGIGRISLIRDPQGARLALLEPLRD